MMASTKPDNPLDRRIAIMDLFDAGEWVGSCAAQDLVDLVGGTVRGVASALNDLGFTIAKRESTKRVPGKGPRKKTVRVPRQYARPTKWPDSYELRKRLRKMGMSASSARQSNVTVVPDRCIEQAIGEVFLNNPEAKDAIKRRGVYKKALRKVVADGMLDVVSVRALAKAIGEDPAVMTPAALLGRAEGLKRVATRQELKETQVPQFNNGRAQ